LADGTHATVQRDKHRAKTREAKRGIKMEKEIDNGLYYDGHDIVNAFIWGMVFGAIVMLVIVFTVLD